MYPTDAGGIWLDGPITNKVGTWSLGKAVGILSMEYFRMIVNTDKRYVFHVF